MRALKFLGTIASDLLYAAGGALLVVGAFMVYRPAGFIVAGALLISLGLIVARHRAKGGGGCAA